jgi:ribonuclease VapC
VSERSVLDASALICLLQREPGWERVEAALPLSCIGAVNLAEVIGRFVERGMPAHDIDAMLGHVQLRAIEFDAEQARAAGLLRLTTRSAGLSLGDRACLALAAKLGVKAVTADRAWKDLNVGVQIEFIR